LETDSRAATHFFMPRYKLTVAYDGTHFHGWQKQQESPEYSAPTDGSESSVEQDERIRTVQGVLERTIRDVLRESVNVLGASRTDAGVHARGQVAAFTSQRDIPVKKLARALTSRLPPDVQVLQAKVVPDDFDPIRGAIAKGYRFRLAHCSAAHRRPLFDRHYTTHTAYRLDPVRMNEAARLLLGEHDFASFARISHGRESTVRTIYECKVVQSSKFRCHLDVAGNGFLYNMIRIIAGTLVEIGRGAREPQSILDTLAARNRDTAGPTLPAEGLCLMWITYPALALETSA
jgi:tRNA pseudouridine38-40 synthase